MQTIENKGGHIYWTITIFFGMGVAPFGCRAHWTMVEAADKP